MGCGNSGPVVDSGYRHPNIQQNGGPTQNQLYGNGNNQEHNTPEPPQRTPTPQPKKASTPPPRTPTPQQEPPQKTPTPPPRTPTPQQEPPQKTPTPPPRTPTPQQEPQDKNEGEKGGQQEEEGTEQPQGDAGENEPMAPTEGAPVAWVDRGMRARVKPEEADDEDMDPDADVDVTEYQNETRESHMGRMVRYSMN